MRMRFLLLVSLLTFASALPARAITLHADGVASATAMPVAAAPGSVQTSAQQVIEGINVPVRVSVSGGRYSLNDQPFTAAEGMARSGDRIRVQLESPRGFGESASAVVTVGQVPYTFAVTTVPEAGVAAPFTLFEQMAPYDPIERHRCPRDSLRFSNVVTIANLLGPTPISIRGGSYRINDGPFTSQNAQVVNGDRVTVRVRSASGYDQTQTADLQVGSVSTGFTVRTVLDPLLGTPTVLNGSETYVYRERAAGQVPLRAFVFKPANWRASERRPAFVHFFGGSWTTGKPSVGRMNWARNLGMVAISVDYRTNERFGTTPMDAMDDARAALRWVQTHADQFGIDPRRIVVSGSSAGGHLALWTAIPQTPYGAQPGSAPLAAPAALSLLSPVTDTIGFAGSGPYGNQFGAHAADSSPLLRLGQRMPPTLIQHGDADEIVPLTASVKACTQLTRSGNRCRLMPFAGGPHQLSSVPGNQAILDRNVETFLIDIGILPAL